MKKQKKRWILFAVLYTVLLLAAGCGIMQDAKESEENTGELPAASGDNEVRMYGLFTIVSVDTAEEKMRLYSYSDGLEYQFSFGLDTEFLDKYGKPCSAMNFTEGRAVCIGKLNYSGKLTRVQLSKDVWNQEKIRRFSVDRERRIFTIGNSKYSYEDDLLLFSDGKRIKWEDITDDDQLYAVGYGKKLLSVSVTTGHGTLSLKNTALFEGSFLQLDNRVFSRITPEMTIDISEGTYTLSVANDGWGGSRELVISRGQTTTVDLDEIKGEGPKYGDIRFKIDLEDAVVYVDGVKQDHSKPLHLKYGRHLLTIKASGIDDWTRYLYVNSEEAVIEIEMEGESIKSTEKESEKASETESESETEPESEEASETEPESEEASGTEPEPESEEVSESEAQSEERTETIAPEETEKASEKESESGENHTQLDLSDEVIKDYLSTLTELLNAIRR